LAIRANRPLFRLSTRRFKIAEPAATGQVRRAMPQSKQKTCLSGWHKPERVTRQNFVRIALLSFRATHVYNVAGIPS
jgi:hypothetical protein